MVEYFTIDMIIKLLAVLFIYIWGGIEIFLQIKQNRQTKTKSNTDKGSFVIIYVAIILSYGIGIPFAFLNYGRIHLGEPYFGMLGLLLIITGVIIRLIARRTLKRFFAYTVVIQDGHELVEQGLYRQIRHPAYLGELIIFFGIGLAFANWISLACLFLFPFIAFSIRINLEEKVLMEHFGSQYAEYRKRSWRLIPYFY